MLCVHLFGDNQELQAVEPVMLKQITGTTLPMDDLFQVLVRHGLDLAPMTVKDCQADCPGRFIMLVKAWNPLVHVALRPPPVDPS